ncbi:GNAT family N-acetyltransferase [Kozakia baliensis]|uniref:Acetyltransferase n=1 Tax=Kozakia baliensis TaxID=153496 RepID=A0A1D8UTL5_9PROT|nr:GNAT family N-acetyltransferase [Kozakia baliensis]AOX16959.1 acetyltransferase [Kozakia baliensis]GBR25463.1 acetyltransferase [Kozakia baliensis NRIC 0488]GEL63993.1 N-acetyltransferase [Kozakia baliensis]
MVELRDATEADLPAILSITNDAIKNSDAIWAYTAQTMAQRRAWMKDRQDKGFPVVVAVEGDVVLGFASYGPFRPYEGYNRTVEHSIYVAELARRRGVGRLLLAEMVIRAERAGMHAIVGVITASNEASVALHRDSGFQSSSVLPEFGRKFGRWLDLVFMYRLFETNSHED